MEISRRSFLRTAVITAAGVPLFGQSGSAVPWFLQPTVDELPINTLDRVTAKPEIRSKQDILNHLNSIDIHRFVQDIYSLVTNEYSDYDIVYDYIKKIGEKGYEMGEMNLPVANLDTYTTNLQLNAAVSKAKGKPALLRYGADSTLGLYNPMDRFHNGMSYITGMSSHLEYLTSSFSKLDPASFELTNQGDIKHTFYAANFSSLTYLINESKTTILSEILKEKPSFLVTALGSAQYEPENFEQNPHLAFRFGALTLNGMIRYISATVNADVLPVFITPPFFFLTEKNKHRFKYISSNNLERFMGPNNQKYRSIVGNSLMVTIIADTLGFPIINTCNLMQKIENEYFFMNDPAHYEDTNHPFDHTNSTSTWNLRNYLQNPAMMAGLIISSTIAALANKFDRSSKKMLHTSSSSLES